MKIQFQIPGRPIPKQSARIGKHGGYQPHRVVDYCNKVRFHCSQAVEGGLWDKTEGAVRVSLTFDFAWPSSTRKAVRSTTGPRIKRPDLENLAKAVIDGCDSLWIDDAQVSELEVVKRNVPIGQEGVTVEVTAV
tara:strand:- start:1380 stop:1781 length:402 start_codon:yes stop_codon:yes gene_type:complete